MAEPTPTEKMVGTAWAVAAAIPFWGWVGASYIILGAIGLVRNATGGPKR